MLPIKVLHESSGSFFQPYLLSEGSTEPVWCRIGASVGENMHGGVSKQDSVVLIDTVAVPNWCFLLRCCTNQVAASSDLTNHPEDRRNLLGVGMGRQWLRIRKEEFRTRTMGVPIDTMAVPNWCFQLRCCTNRVAASFNLTYYPRDRPNQFGVGLGRQWVRICMEEFRNRTVWS